LQGERAVLMKKVQQYEQEKKDKQMFPNKLDERDHADDDCRDEEDEKGKQEEYEIDGKDGYESDEEDEEFNDLDEEDIEEHPYI
jgi:hypothetical protein